MDKSIEGFAEAFSVDPESVQPTDAGNCNESWYATKSGEPVVIRLSPPGTDGAALENRAVMQDALASSGAPVARPILSSAGRFVETVRKEGSTRLLSAFQRMPGRSHETIDDGALDDRCFVSLGRALARLHGAFDRMPAFQERLPSWETVESCFNYGGTGESAVIDAYRMRRAACLRHEKTAPWFGAVHGDLHFDNIIIDGESGAVAFCDFDDCCRGRRAMDLALLRLDLDVVMIGEKKEPLVHRRGLRAKEAFALILEGYGRENTVLVAERVEIGHFAALLEASLFLQYHDVGHDESPDSWLGRFLPGLREKIAADPEGLAWGA